jgi:hypothetical protein
LIWDGLGRKDASLNLHYLTTIWQECPTNVQKTSIASKCSLNPIMSSLYAVDAALGAHLAKIVVTAFEAAKMVAFEIVLAAITDSL